MSLKSGIYTPYHNIGFADEAGYFSTIHEKIGKNLSGDYAVLYSLEPAPDEQSRTAILDRMEREGIEDARRHADVGLLTIMNSDSPYYRAGINPKKLEDLWRSYFSDTYRKIKNNAKGILGIYSAEPYFKRNHHDSFIAFEIITGKTIGKRPSELLCWYKKEWLGQLTFGQLIHLVTSHYTTAHRGWRYRIHDDREVADMAAIGMARVLGEKPTLALFETMRMRFGLERGDLVSRPELFEDILITMLGEDDARSVFRSIADEYRQELSFDSSQDGKSARRK